MFCPKCGREIEDNSTDCNYCGQPLAQSMSAQTQRSNYNESKTGMGILFGLLLGLIGLIIGICIYPEGTLARKTFIKSWIICFVVQIVVSVILSIVLFTTSAVKSIEFAL